MKKLYIQTSIEDETPSRIDEYITNHGILRFEGTSTWVDRLGFGNNAVEWWLKETTIEELTVPKTAQA